MEHASPPPINVKNLKRRSPDPLRVVVALGALLTRVPSYERFSAPAVAENQPGLMSEM